MQVVINTYTFVGKLANVVTMEKFEIKEIGGKLKLYGLVSELADRIQAQIPTRTNTRDAVYRAFRDTDSETEYMRYIRIAGKKLLEEKNLLGAALTTEVA